MYRSSFAVGYHTNRGYCMSRVTKVVLGVTSIVPNLNGVLLFVENGRHIQIEKHELVGGDLLPNMFISYEDREDFEEIDHYEVIDCRE